MVCVVMGSALAGCASLPAIWNLKEAPGFHQDDLSMSKVVYDPSIRAYRLAKSRDGKETMTGTVLRGVDWRKISTEEELKRVISAYTSPQIGTGTKISAYGLAALYSPIVAAEAVAGAVISLPLQPFVLYDQYHNRHRVRRAVEEAYHKGRVHFEAGEYQGALDQWEDAMRWDAWFQMVSDVDYWRGRTYERLGNGREALTAYLDFLDYSERSFPSYFEAPPKDHPPWPDKAADTERRLRGLSTPEKTAAK
jgi:tetratricopeptide (TPR) repeat protein